MGWDDTWTLGQVYQLMHAGKNWRCMISWGKESEGQASGGQRLRNEIRGGAKRDAMAGWSLM